MQQMGSELTEPAGLGNRFTRVLDSLASASEHARGVRDSQAEILKELGLPAYSEPMPAAPPAPGVALRPDWSEKVAETIEDIRRYLHEIQAMADIILGKPMAGGQGRDVR